jgi:hypothetical protein
VFQIQGTNQKPYGMPELIQACFRFETDSFLIFVVQNPNLLTQIRGKMKKIAFLMMAMLSVTFAFSQTKTEIKQASLPKGVSSYITKNFSGYSVDKAFKIDNKGMMSTQVMVSKGAEQLALTFDKEFKLTKKEAIKPDTKMVSGKDEKKPLPPVKK